MNIAAPQHIEISGDLELIERGAKLISEGQLAAIVLAGGQGTRLGFDHPKGCFPVSPVKNKSLFQVLAEKTIAASNKAGRPLFIAIMTSPENNRETQEFFEKHNFFGLKKSQLWFFSQGELPFKNLNGQPLEIKAPDGNGGVFEELKSQKIYELWKKEGVEYVNIVLIDNPLADPFDENLVGFVENRNLDVAVKCIEKRDADEKVGLIFQADDKLKVIEYSELLKEQRELSNYANLSLFCLTMNFVNHLAVQEFPIHQALKPISPTENGWKSEKFIFDLLNFTSKSACLAYDRSECFAPLKNKEGNDSIETVKAAWTLRDQRILSEITGVAQNQTPLELSADFLYPTSVFLQNWKNRSIDPHQSYLE